MTWHINTKALQRQKLKEAASWVDRRSGKDWHADDEAAFQSWLSASPNAAGAYNQIAATWNDPLLSEALSEAVIAVKPRPYRTAWVVARTAAVTAGIAFMVYGVVFLKVPERAQPTAYASVAAGSVHKIVLLSDGTQMDMNAGTKAQVAYSSKARTLDLQSGEVFLNVKPDAARPFEVRTAFGKVLVTGTSFNVNAMRSQLEVSVRHGNVQVQSPFGKQANLKAGQTVRVRNGEMGRISGVNLTAIDAWRHPWLETNSISIADLAAQLEAEHGINIIFGSDAIGRLIVSGRFSTSDPKALFEDLGLVHGFTVTQSGEIIKIKMSK